MTPIIDSHVHLFDLTLGQYDWLKAENPPFWPDKSRIAKSFTCSDLDLSSSQNLAGFVHIEAGFDNLSPHKELEYLHKSLGSRLPFKSIAFADIGLAPNVFLEQLEALSQYPSFCGVRYILDQQAIDLSLNGRPKANVLANLKTLSQQHLIFELQCDMASSPVAECIHRLFSQVPELKLVLNHGGFAPIGSEKPLSSLKKWQANLNQLSTLSNVRVKCSGLEMMSRQFTKKQFVDVLSVLLNSFGEQRVMLASNFPLILFRMSYQEYWSMVQNSLDEIEACASKLIYTNAREFYGFI